MAFQLVERFIPQLFIHAALNDPKEGILTLPSASGALRPAHRQPHGIRRLLLARRVSRAFVERHRDVGIQHLLDAHRFLGREEQAIAVDRRGKLHAVLRQFSHRGQGKNLEAPRVGEDRLVPAHEAVQAAVLADHLESRPQPEVEGIAEDDLRAERGELVGRHGLHRAVGADRHEGRRVDTAVRELERAAAGLAIGVQDLELHRSMSIASP